MRGLILTYSVINTPHEYRKNWFTSSEKLYFLVFHPNVFFLQFYARHRNRDSSRILAAHFYAKIYTICCSQWSVKLLTDGFNLSGLDRTILEVEVTQSLTRLRIPISKREISLSRWSRIYMMVTRCHNPDMLEKNQGKFCGTSMHWNRRRERLDSGVHYFLLPQRVRYRTRSTPIGL